MFYILSFLLVKYYTNYTRFSLKICKFPFGKSTFDGLSVDFNNAFFYMGWFQTIFTNKHLKCVRHIKFCLLFLISFIIHCY